MHKILIVGKSLEQGGEFGSAELMKNKLNELNSTDLEFYFTRFDSLIFSMSTDEISVYDSDNNLSINSYDFVFLRDWFIDNKEHAQALAMYLESANIKYANKEALKNRSSSKLTQYMYMATEHIPMPKTVYAKHNNLLEVSKELKWPIIVKERGGRRGSHNFLINDIGELKATLNKHKSLRFMCQEYIENDHDLRVLFYKDKAHLVMKRARTTNDTHLNNTSQGAEAELLEVNYIPKPIIEDMKKLSDRFGRTFTGIDLIYDPKSGNYSFLEINNMPQLETGSYVKEKLTVFTEIINRELSE